VTVTAIACLALSRLVDEGSIMFWSWLTSKADEVKVLSKKTRIMVIMSIIGVMLRLVISSGSASLRAKLRTARLPLRRSDISGDAGMA